MIRVAASYHPAYILRNPSAGLATEAHLRMVKDHLWGTLSMETKAEDLRVEYAVPPPKEPVGWVAMDIETYGILQGQNQTQFHPRKSEAYDGVPRERMVVTVALTWNEPPSVERRDWEEGGTTFHPGGLRHSVFVMRDPGDRRVLAAWFKKIREDGPKSGLFGQNFVFDLMYLRYCYPSFRRWLDYPLRIGDLMVTNYLHDEGRPERSLKALAPLLRVTQYEDDGAFKQYSGPDNPDLHRYNCQDTMATFRCREKLEQGIRSFYGKDTEKLSPFTVQWFSDLLWFVVWATEEGIAVDEGRLARLSVHFQARRERLIRLAQEFFGFPLRGKGSDKAKRAILQQAVDMAGKDLPAGRLVLTAKTKRISFAAENRNLLLDTLPRDSWASAKLRLIGRYQDVDKIVSSYLVPILEGGRNGKDLHTKHIDGILYPRIFPVPSEFDDGSVGGTKQARIVYKGPGVQTFPPIIKGCIINRFTGGPPVWTDASQIELRTAALLSGDPAMCKEYMGKPDLHGKTATLMFGGKIKEHPQYKKKYRFAGKTFNFRALYRGGAQMAQDTLMKDLGIQLSLQRIQEIDDAFWTRHAQLARWQEYLFAFVKRHGYYILPLTGQSRLFLGGEDMQRKQISEICNLPVQAVAANIALSAQITLWQRLRAEGLKTVVSLNVYDAMCLEVPRGELPRVLELMHEVLPDPPYYQALCDRLDRRLPLVWEYETEKGGKTLEIGAPI